jgi:hypothetical protein
MTDSGSTRKETELESDKYYYTESQSKNSEFGGAAGSSTYRDIVPDSKLTEDSQNSAQDMLGSVYERSERSMKSSKNSVQYYTVAGTINGVPLTIPESASEEEKQRLTLSYEREIEDYLASLPSNVSYDDIISINAKQVKLNEKSVLNFNENVEKAAAKEPPKLEYKFAKNLHYFCMLEEERRGLLLLPDEMKNITRKFHTRDKYEHVSIIFFILA